MRMGQYFRKRRRLRTALTVSVLAMVLVTVIVLACSATAMIYAGQKAAGGTGLFIGIGLALAGILAWMAALRDFSGTPADTVNATLLLLRGTEAPQPRPDLTDLRADQIRLS